MAKSQPSNVSSEDLKALLEKYPRVNPTVDAHLLAIITTGRILGSAWSAKWGFEFSKKNKPGMHFRPSEDPNDQHVIWRQIRFAELLFNLQSLDGFNARRAEWLGNGPEAILAELESAFYLLACGHQPSFVVVKPDQTPDFEVTLSFGLKCVLETKAKLETAEFDEEKLVDTLKKAKRKMPRDANNVILVRIPEKWSLEPDFETRIQKIIGQFFSNSERAISVLLYWELWHTPRDGAPTLGVSGMEFPNSKWDEKTSGRRIIEDYSGFPDGWIHLDEV